VLLTIRTRLLFELSERAKARKARSRELDINFAERAKLIREPHKFQPPAGLPPDAAVKTITFNLMIIEYEFCGGRFRISVSALSDCVCMPTGKVAFALSILQCMAISFF
jgi:hypothetical protein